MSYHEHAWKAKGMRAQSSLSFFVFIKRKAYGRGEHTPQILARKPKAIRANNLLSFYVFYVGSLKPGAHLWSNFVCLRFKA